MRNHLITTSLATVVIAGCALAMLGQPADANQSGPGVNDQIWGWSVLCAMHGGEATIDFHPGSGGDVSCKGGRLGGLTCFLYNDTSKSWCDHSKASAQPGAWASSSIDPTTIPLVVQVPVPAGTISLDPAARPQLFDARIAWPATSGVAQGLMVADVHACKLGGGRATAMTRLPESSDSLVVRCEGGVFEGHTCDVAAGMATCFTDSAPLTTSPSLPATEPPATTEPVSPAATKSVSPESTALPTTEPADEPVIEPTAAPTDAGPWTVPEGTLPVFEPAEPSPTTVILT